MSKTYVYGGQEVEATGRTAVRPGRRNNHVLYEIKPIGGDSTDAKFFQWVRLEDLFHIQPDNEINNNQEE
jgi:hypothetical protein